MIREISAKADNDGLPLMSAQMSGETPHSALGTWCGSAHAARTNSLNLIAGKRFEQGTGAVSLAGVLAALSPRVLAILNRPPFLAISGTNLLTHTDAPGRIILITQSCREHSRFDFRP